MEVRGWGEGVGNQCGGHLWIDSGVRGGAAVADEDRSAIQAENLGVMEFAMLNRCVCD